MGNFRVMNHANGSAAPVFIHVDVDDLWAIAECYGLRAAEEYAHAVSEDALPRLRRLFAGRGIHATFFVVGKDLDNPLYVKNMRDLLSDGHALANHSFSHRLDFRAICKEAMRDQILRCHDKVQDLLSYKMQGFRAPGYAWSRPLLEVLGELEYAYDASLMPSPWGFVFRWMDRRLQRQAVKLQGRSAGHVGGAGETKTQYPLFTDTFNPLRPRRVETASGRSILQLTSATAPQLRLPFQAGVCMRLGYAYFENFALDMVWRRRHPFVFLFHAADLADLSRVPIPFFQKSKFFNMPIQEREKLADQFLQFICEWRQVVTTEEWL